MSPASTTPCGFHSICCFAFRTLITTAGVCYPFHTTSLPPSALPVPVITGTLELSSSSWRLGTWSLPLQVLPSCCMLLSSTQVAHWPLGLLTSGCFLSQAPQQPPPAAQPGPVVAESTPPTKTGAVAAPSAS
jgi:hypothetical protein